MSGEEFNNYDMFNSGNSNTEYSYENNTIYEEAQHTNNLYLPNTATFSSGQRTPSPGQNNSNVEVGL